MEYNEKKEGETCYAYVDAEMAQFEEVAGTCSNKDNKDEPCLTVRSVVIGLMYVVGMSYVHQWSSFQPYAITITSVLVIVTSYPIGKLWSFIFRTKEFSLKEHGFILIMANVAYMYNSVFVYATLTSLKVLEREDVSFAYYFFFSLSIQFLGFGLAG